MKNIPVDLQPLEEFWNFDLHEFEPGKSYPLSELFEALGLVGLAKGRPKDKPCWNKKERT